ERGNRVSVACQVQRERAVIAEAVERSPARQLADQMSVLALIQERTGFLARPRCRQILHAVFIDFDLLRNLTVQQHRFARQSLALARPGVVPGQDADGREKIDQSSDYVLCTGFDAGAGQLSHDVVAVPVHHERWQGIPFAVYDAPRVGASRKRRPALLRGTYARLPPRPVDHRARVTVQQPERYFGPRTPQRDAKGFPALIMYFHDSGAGIRRRDHVAPENPRVTGVPSSGTTC